jgi:hypothetical protein
MQKLKIQNGWEGKGNHCCEGDDTGMSSILPLTLLWSLHSLQRVYVLCEFKVDVSNPDTTKCEVHSVIQFLNKKGEAPAEVNCQIVSVYGDDMNRQNVAKWCHEFNTGRRDIHDEQRTGRASLIVDGLVKKMNKTFMLTGV